MTKTQLTIALWAATTAAGMMTILFLNLGLLWVFIVLMCITAAVAW